MFVQTLEHKLDISCLEWKSKSQNYALASISSVRLIEVISKFTCKPDTTCTWDMKNYRNSYDEDMTYTPRGPADTG